ncbi:uncharacterized protein ACIBXB_017338 [Morphnus guianensis]
MRAARKQPSCENTTAIQRLTPLGKQGLFRPGKDAQGLAQRDAESSWQAGISADQKVMEHPKALSVAPETLLKYLPARAGEGFSQRSTPEIQSGWTDILLPRERFLGGNITPALKWKRSLSPQGAAPGFPVPRDPRGSASILHQKRSQGKILPLTGGKKKKSLVREIAGRQAAICSSIGKNVPFSEVDGARRVLPSALWDGARPTAPERGLAKGIRAWRWDSRSPDTPGLGQPAVFCFSSAAQTFFRVSSWWSVPPSLLLVAIWGETKGFLQVRSTDVCSGKLLAMGAGPRRVLLCSCRCAPQIPRLPGPLDPTFATSLLVCPLLAFIVPAESLLLASATLLSLGSHLHPTSGPSLSPLLLCVPPSPSAVPKIPRPVWGQFKGMLERVWGRGLLGWSGLGTRKNWWGPGPRGGWGLQTTAQGRPQHAEVHGGALAALLLLFFP